MQDDAEFEEWEGVLDQIVVKLVHFAEEGVECNQRSHAQFIFNNYKGPFVCYFWQYVQSPCTHDIGFYVVQLEVQYHQMLEQQKLSPFL